MASWWGGGFCGGGALLAVYCGCLPLPAPTAPLGTVTPPPRVLAPPPVRPPPPIVMITITPAPIVAIVIAVDVVGAGRVDGLVRHLGRLIIASERRRRGGERAHDGNGGEQLSQHRSLLAGWDERATLKFMERRLQLGDACVP